MIQQHPEDVAWFIKVVMSCGSVSSIFLAAQCGAFLSMHWASCGECSRPLRYWVLMLCILKIVQAPVRIVFFLRLWQYHSHEGSVQDCVLEITQSMAWRASKLVSMFTYGWFLLGLIWLSNTIRCTPRLYALAMEVVVQTVVRMCMTIVFYRCFLQREPADAAPAAPPPQGAEQITIDSIPSIVHAGEPAHAGDGGGNGACRADCAVCLTAFEHGEVLRQLPCSHSFHLMCIDPWLRLNSVCPLCLRDIAAPPPPPPVPFAAFRGRPKRRIRGAMD